MRKLSVCNIVSLDGFFSGPGPGVVGEGVRAFDGSSLLLARYAVER